MYASFTRNDAFGLESSPISEIKWLAIHIGNLSACQLHQQFAYCMILELWRMKLWKERPRFSVDCWGHVAVGDRYWHLPEQEQYTLLDCPFGRVGLRCLNVVRSAHAGPAKHY